MDEKSIIQLARKIFGDYLIHGDINDDASILSFSRDTLYVLTMDTLSRSADFPALFSSFDMGWKVVAVSLSDIAAMGATPLGFMLSCCFDSQFQESKIDKFFYGVKSCLNEFSTSFLGGDTNKSEDASFSGFCIGLCEQKNILLRKNAKVNDIIFLTNSVGLASAGLDLILHLEDRIGPQYYQLLNAFYRPYPRVKDALRIKHLVNSATDISDSLAISLYNIATNSKKGMKIFADRLRIHPQVENIAHLMRKDIYQYVLYGGEDFELLFTAPAKNTEKIIQLLSELGTEVYPIGKVISDRKVILSKEGKEEELSMEGFQHII
jgi:thiamine-monophosphate kinase